MHDSSPNGTRAFEVGDVSRRTFVRFSMASTVLLAGGVQASLRALMPTRSKNLKILILGGTGFLGPACMETALAAGHTVTLFNRGRTEDRRKRAGRASVIPDGVEVLYGNRDPKKTADADDNDQAGDTKVDGSPMGLSQLEGRKWDAVIDTSGYWPRIAKASAELLAPNVGQYVFVSTISVYKSNDKVGANESAELTTLADPTVEDFGADFSNYGGGKAMAEAAVEAAMPGRATLIRPGFIVGPRDSSQRFIYWPVRASKGGTMIVPGSPDDPIQIVDVRDLADFIVRCIEQKHVGAFDVTGPEKKLSMRAMVEGCIAGTGGKTTAEWVDAKFLEEQEVNPQMFPLWIPPSGETAGFHQRDVSKAVKAGLTFRPVSDTAKATLDWYNGLSDDLKSKMVGGMLDPEKEKELAAGFKKSKGG